MPAGQGPEKEQMKGMPPQLPGRVTRRVWKRNQQRFRLHVRESWRARQEGGSPGAKRTPPSERGHAAPSSKHGVSPGPPPSAERDQEEGRRWC